MSGPQLGIKRKLDDADGDMGVRALVVASVSR
jgi:hypothetical protein